MSSFLAENSRAACQRKFGDDSKDKVIRISPESLAELLSIDYGRVVDIMTFDCSHLFGILVEMPKHTSVKQSADQT